MSVFEDFERAEQSFAALAPDDPVRMRREIDVLRLHMMDHHKRLFDLERDLNTVSEHLADVVDFIENHADMEQAVGLSRSIMLREWRAQWSRST